MFCEYDIHSIRFFPSTVSHTVPTLTESNDNQLNQIRSRKGSPGSGSLPIPGKQHCAFQFNIEGLI